MAAKSMPSVTEMMRQLEKTAPVNAYDALARFKEHNWKALNSFVHAGIHPLSRHADPYPDALLKAVLCNANGVGVMSCMQAVVLSGEPPLQRQVLEIAARYTRCLPEPLRPPG